VADDAEDWWVRAGVAYVLRYVEQPETGMYVTHSIRGFFAERSVFGRNRIHNAIEATAKRGRADEAIVLALIEDARGPAGPKANTAVNLLSVLGPSAEPALPIFEEKMAAAKKRADNAKDPGERKSFGKQVAKWQGVINQIRPPK